MAWVKDYISVFFGFLIIFIIVVLFRAIIKKSERDRMIDEATDHYSELVLRADQAIRKANERLAALGKIVFSENARTRIDEITAAKADYMIVYRQARAAIDDAYDARRDAYQAMSKGIRIQNMYLNGANDLSARTLYKREDRLHGIEVTEKLTDPTQVLDQVNRLISYQETRNEIYKELAEKGIISGTYTDSGSGKDIIREKSRVENTPAAVCPAGGNPEMKEINPADELPEEKTAFEYEPAAARKGKTFQVLAAVAAVVLVLGLGGYFFIINNPDFAQKIGGWTSRITGKATARTVEMTSTQVYAGVTYTVEKNGKSSGTLIITSGTSESWSFGPWAGTSSTITLERTDGTRSYAFVDIGGMHRQYQTSFFDQGKTLRFDLDFDGNSDAEWSSVQINVHRFGSPSDDRVVIPFEVSPVET